MTIEATKQIQALRDKAASEQRNHAVKNTYDQVRKQIEDKQKLKELEKQLAYVERDNFGRVIS